MNIEEKYAKLFFCRADRTVPGLRDRSLSEFSLSARPFSLRWQGLALNGFFYEGERPNGRLVVFAHGYGAGHEAYLTEINALCEEGYEVCAFDYAGCVRSEGEMIGFHAAVSQMNEVLDELERRGKKEYDLVGHSWGGYVAACCASRAKAAVSIGGFVKPSDVLTGLLGEDPVPFLRTKFKQEGNRAVQACSTPVLAIQGDRDRTVPINQSLYASGLFNVVPFLAEGKEHNAYNSARAEAYLNEVLGKIPALKEEEKEEFYASIDYRRITEEDPLIMQTIFDFLKNA